MAPRLLGHGSYSRVFTHGTEYAIKEIVNPKWIDGMGSVKDYQVYCWQEDDSQRLVPYVGVVKHKRAFQSYMTSKFDGNYDPYKYIMPKMVDCSNFYKRHENDMTDALQRAARDILLDLIYLNDRGFVHLDVKPDNILESDGKYRLCDFGFITHIDPGQTKCVGQCSFTPCYAPPEHISKYITGINGDVWSLGVSLYEMATGLFMVPSKRHDRLRYAKEFQSSGRWIDTFNEYAKLSDGAVKEQLINLIGRCLVYDYHQRPTPRELIQHPFISLEVPPFTNPVLSVSFPGQESFQQWYQLTHSSPTNYLSPTEIDHGTALYLRFCELANVEPNFPSNTWGVCLYLVYKLLRSPVDVVKFDHCIPYRFIREQVKVEKLYKYEKIIVVKCRGIWFNLDCTTQRVGR